MATTATKHYRNGPDMDVAMCGERGGQIVFSRARSGVTCADCTTRLDKAIASKRVRREEAARSAFYKSRGAA